MNGTTQQTPPPVNPPVVRRRSPSKGFIAVVSVIGILAVVGIIAAARSCGGENAPAPTKVSVNTPPQPAVPESAETPPAEPAVTEEEPEVVALDSKCFCDCRDNGKSVARCLEECLKCDADECKEEVKQPQHTARVQHPFQPAPAAPAAPPVQVQQPTQPPATTASRSCEGPSATLGPEVAGLVVQGKVVTWTDPCYTKLVLYGEHGREFPLVTFNSPSKRVTLPTEYLDAGYDRFSLQTPDGRWALIHAGSNGGCVVNEGPRGHAYLIACH